MFKGDKSLGMPECRRLSIRVSISGIEVGITEASRLTRTPLDK